jgi:hypothetical protein
LASKRAPASREWADPFDDCRPCEDGGLSRASPVRRGSRALIAAVDPTQGLATPVAHRTNDESAAPDLHHWCVHFGTCSCAVPVHTP